MSLLQVQNASITFSDTPLFSHVSFFLEKGEKMALVGVNGAGKTTLFRAIADPTLLYEGTVSFARQCRIGQMEQYDKSDPEWTVLETAERIFSALRKKEETLATMEAQMANDPTSDNIARYTMLRQEFEREGGYTYKSLARGTLIRLGFTEEMLAHKVKTLSGGQKAILRLSLILLDEPDLMLLDEPTNHLDVRAIEWLEDQICRTKSAVLIISHDRMFLEHTTTKTLELENGTATLYPVPYTRYREEKKKRQEVLQKHYDNQQKEIARLEAFIAQQKRWNRERNIIAAESRQKALDRMEKVDRAAPPPPTLSFSFADAIASGEDVLSVLNLSKQYGEKVLFSDLCFSVKKGERLVIVGANGSGKSTLLQILSGNVFQDGGSFTFGYNVRCGYYDQAQHLNEENTVIEEIWQDLSTSQTQIRQLLATFLFFGEDVYKPVSVLSGGERARLILAKLLQKKVNVLLLDEPTNHLDIDSCEALEDAILTFSGTVIAVSHDRYFIQKIATRTLSFEGNGVIVERLGDDLSANGKQLTQSAVFSSDTNTQGKQSDWQERREKRRQERKLSADMTRLEKSVQKAEARLTEITKEEEAAASDYETLQRLYEEKAMLEEQRDKDLEMWLLMQES